MFGEEEEERVEVGSWTPMATQVPYFEVWGFRAWFSKMVRGCC
jgi:hypothetical protein